METSVDRENSTIINEIIKIYEDVGGIYGYRHMTILIKVNLDNSYQKKYQNITKK